MKKNQDILTLTNNDLTHPAFLKCTQWGRLLNKCNKLSTFCGRLNRISAEIAESSNVHDYYKFEDDLVGSNAGNKFKGDVFEAFCELLIKMSPLDERIGLTNYQVVTEDDTGVDGFGLDRQGRPVAVQIKYRMWDYELSHISEHLNNFRLTAYQKFGVDPRLENNLLIITTGKEINWRTLERQFQGKVRCINGNASYRCLRGSENKTVKGLYSLKTIVDGNEFFWETMRKQANA